MAHAERLLLADIGGTHTRLCITEPDADLTSIQAFENAAFETLESLLLHYVKEQRADPGSLTGRFGVACPVTNDVIKLTNWIGHWTGGIAEPEGTRVQVKSSEQIASAALSASDPLAQRTVDHYLAMLGGFAGDLALTLGARGGVYLARTRCGPSSIIRMRR